MMLSILTGWLSTVSDQVAMGDDDKLTHGKIKTNMDTLCVPHVSFATPRLIACAV